VGWLLVAAGAVVMLYVVYALFYTNTVTEQAQDELLEEWNLTVPGGVAGAVEGGSVVEPVVEVEPLPGSPVDEQQIVGEPVEAESPVAEPVVTTAGEAIAVMQFSRPGSDVPVVTADPLFVVDGVSVEDLKSGPGHYGATALPGQPGNFAVAGHRTTYAAPFFNLEQATPGDEILVTDRAGQRWTYTVVEQRIVDPGDTSVIGPDPLGTGRPTLTLTTCHPRFSAAQRLILFAELAA